MKIYNINTVFKHILIQVSEDYEEWKNFRYPHLAELLTEFPSIQLDPSLLISELPLLQPRYYSISSSKAVAPDEVHITVSLLSYRTQGIEIFLHILY